MHFIDCLVLPQAQSSHQQHNVEPIREPRQRQRIRLRTPMRPLVSWTLRVRAAIACMRHLDHLPQRDHRALGERLHLP